MVQSRMTETGSKPSAPTTRLRRLCGETLPIGLSLVLGLAVTAYFVAHAVRSIRFPFPLDYGEGPLLEQARLLASGNDIYRATGGDYPFTTTNYPPVFPAMLAVGVRLFGIGFGFGRILCFAGAVALAALVGAIVLTCTRDRAASWIASAMFLASAHVEFWSRLARIDFVALSFSLCALLVVLRRRQWRYCAILAGVLVACAVLTRQSYLLATPLAIGGSFAVSKR